MKRKFKYENLEDVKAIVVVDGDNIEVVAVEIVESIDDMVEFFANAIVDKVFGRHYIDREAVKNVINGKDARLLDLIESNEYWMPQLILKELIGKTNIWEDSWETRRLYRLFLEKYGKEVEKLAGKKILEKAKKIGFKG